MNIIIQLIIPGIQSMAYSKKKRLFHTLETKQSTEENNWVVAFFWFCALRVCIIPTTKRFSPIIWHPDHKTAQQEKVMSDFWVPKWHMKMAPIIPLIHTRHKHGGLQWSALFLLS